MVSLHRKVINALLSIVFDLPLRSSYVSTFLLPMKSVCSKCETGFALCGNAYYVEVH